MAGTTLGTAYVQIVPSAQGIKGSLTSMLDSESQAAGTSSGMKIGSFVKKALVATGIGAAVGAAVKNGLSEGAKLEQNIGGAHAVFGDKLYSGLEKRASQAYKNMGLSASDYYETANKMGSLFQGSGLSQKKSLDLTTSAMQRAADVASVMGIDTSTAMESIAGAAKGNFTMMDNLGVAMNATTLDAYALEKGINFDWNTASNAEKAQLAMKMFMDRTSQYSGNFAKEASETFSGSLDAMKASVQNLFGALATGSGVTEAMTALITTASDFFFGNFIPMIGTMVQALPPAIMTFAQQGIPLLVNNFLSLVKTLADRITIFAAGITGKKVQQWAGQNGPKFVDAAGKLIGQFARGMITNLPRIVSALGRIGLAIVRGLGASLWGKVTQAAKGIYDRFMAPINKMKDKVKGVIDKIKGWFPFNLGKILKLQLPKITLNKKTASILGKSITYPTGFSIAWHAKGGIFTRPTLLTGADGSVHGVGDVRGGEAILPLKELWKHIDGAGGVTINVYASDNMSVTDLADEVQRRIIQMQKRRQYAWR